MKELGRLLRRVEAPAGPAKLRAEGLVLGYDEATVIDGLEVEVPPGRITSVVGPNGCGKSTLLRSLARLLRPRGGGVYLDGKEI